jgi:choline dehydrogenase-like flavoprotein
MPQKVYDAIIVGSGATGGWAAKHLAESGLEVLVLEAGRKLDPLKDYTEHTFPFETEMTGNFLNVLES